MAATSRVGRINQYRRTEGKSSARICGPGEGRPAQKALSGTSAGQALKEKFLMVSSFISIEKPAFPGGM
jgi:hypothetical protein